MIVLPLTLKSKPYHSSPPNLSLKLPMTKYSNRICQQKQIKSECIPNKKGSTSVITVRLCIDLFALC